MNTDFFQIRYQVIIRLRGAVLRSNSLSQRLEK